MPKKKWKLVDNLFGRPLVREKKERIGRNPQTGAPIPISARRVLTFKPSQVLKGILNPHKERLKREAQEKAQSPAPSGGPTTDSADV